MTPKKIEARFEQVRAAILAHAAFFVDNDSVQATWRTYRGHRLGPYFRGGCRQRSMRHVGQQFQPGISQRRDPPDRVTIHGAAQ